MKLLHVHGRHLPGIGELDFRPAGQLVGIVGSLAPRLGDYLARTMGSPASDDPPPEEGSGLPSLEAVFESRGGPLRIVGPGVRGSEGVEAFAALAEEAGLEAEELALAWSGPISIGLQDFFERGVTLLCRLHGAGGAEDLLERLRTDGGGPDDAEDPALRTELAEVRERIVALRDVPERLRELEEKIRSLRGDHVEVEGDLEVATMEWLRERQDAETHLQTYRDQARELRDRLHRMKESGSDEPCPTCGRPLADHFTEVVERLEEEFEDIVQDGKWWRRRREQLELKPEGLRELEGQAVRLQAEIEATSEEVERCRFELRDLDELRARERDLLARMVGVRDSGTTKLPDGEFDPSVLAAVLAGAVDGLESDLRTAWIRRAARVANQITGGGVLGLREFDGELGAVGLDGSPVLTGLAPMALHLALAEWLRERGVRQDSILLDLPMASEAPRILERVRRRIVKGPLDGAVALVLTRTDVVDRAPETVHRIVEVEPGEVRVRAGGVTRWTLAGGTGPRRG